MPQPLTLAGLELLAFHNLEDVFKAHKIEFDGKGLQNAIGAVGFQVGRPLPPERATLVAIAELIPRAPHDDLPGFADGSSGGSTPSGAGPGDDPHESTDAEPSEWEDAIPPDLLARVLGFTGKLLSMASTPNELKRAARNETLRGEWRDLRTALGAAGDRQAIRRFTSTLDRIFDGGSTR